MYAAIAVTGAMLMATVAFVFVALMFVLYPLAGVISIFIAIFFFVWGVTFLFDWAVEQDIHR